MTDDTIRHALERIRDYRPRGPVNEWSSAAAFREVQQIAADALDPGRRAARLKAAEAVRVADRRRVGALKRGARYFIADTQPGTGAWVRFLKGDGQRDGIAHVKVIDVVGTPFGTYKPGDQFEVYAGHLQAGPGKPLGSDSLEGP